MRFPLLPPPGLAARSLVLVHTFSSAALPVLPAGLTLAERTGAAVHLVHALPPETAGNAWRMQQAQARLAALRLHYRHVLLGQAPFHTAVIGPEAAAPTVAAYARSVDAGLIVTPEPPAEIADAPCPVMAAATLLLLLARPAEASLAPVLATLLPASGDGALAAAAPA